SPRPGGALRKTASMPLHATSYTFRVRYADTDQMHSYYHARALEWFEAARSELSRAMGLPYVEWERRGAFLPVVEAHVRFRGRAVYDDLLRMTVRVEADGRSRLCFFNTVTQADSGAAVCDGWTRHVVVGEGGRPRKLPDWIRALLPPGSPPAPPPSSAPSSADDG
ncbi:MAG: acyl-CoA thioesterase, partial [Opitutales bacterium]